MVQFARSMDDEEEYAFKFFISRDKFEAERTATAHWILGAMLPRLEGMYDSRGSPLNDPRGHALPPCIIMERGESLLEWFQRRKPDLRTALPVRHPMHGAQSWRILSTLARRVCSLVTGRQEAAGVLNGAGRARGAEAGA